MAHDATRRKEMKNSKAVALAIGLIALFTVAYAQPSGTLRANIPFQFMAGDKAMPAGEYRVEVDSAFHRMALRLADGNAALYVTIHPSQPAASAPEGSMLVFHKYGKQYFLRTAWTAGEVRGFELPASRAERETAKLAAPHEVASVRAK
jgi:hypothetical protein